MALYADLQWRVVHGAVAMHRDGAHRDPRAGEHCFFCQAEETLQNWAPWWSGQPCAYNAVRCRWCRFDSWPVTSLSACLHPLSCHSLLSIKKHLWPKNLQNLGLSCPELASLFFFVATVSSWLRVHLSR